MKALILAVCCTCVLTFSEVAPAAQLSSPMIYGTAEQALAECAIINGGASAQAVSVKLVSEFGDTIGPLDCGGPRLGPGQFCSLVTLIDNETAYTCVATAGSIANLRGGLVFHRHVQDSNGILVLHPLRFAPLR